MTYGLLQSLVEADQNLLLYLNGFHNTFGDYFMPVFTGKWIWIPMYASILYVLLKNFHWKIVLFCLIGIALTITFADQVCATVIRPIVERPRPSNPASPIAELVHIVNGRRGGGFGFPSCHASNSFGLAFFLVFLFRKRWLSIFICTWAAINCYAYLSGIALSGRFSGRNVSRIGWSYVDVLPAHKSYQRRFQKSTSNTGYHLYRITNGDGYTGLFSYTGDIIRNRKKE